MKKLKFTASKYCKLSDLVKAEVDYLNYNSLQKILRKKDVKINGERVSVDKKLNIGDIVEIFCPENETKYYEIVFNDDKIIIVNKKQGIIVQSKDKTKASEVALQEIIEKDLKVRLFPLHRIDRNTGGVVIFCKSKKVFDQMKNCMEFGEIEKFYLAEVDGEFELPDGEYHAFLNKNSAISKVYVSDKKENAEAMPIITIIKTIKKQNGTSLLEVQIKNGKTHQIRAHLAFLGYPLIGDNKYGNKNINKEYGTRKQKLTAYKIIFNIKGGPMKYLNDIIIELK